MSQTILDKQKSQSLAENESSLAELETLLKTRNLVNGKTPKEQLEALAIEQGVKPITDFGKLYENFPGNPDDLMTFVTKERAERRKHAGEKIAKLTVSD